MNERERVVEDYFLIGVQWCKIMFPLSVGQEWENWGASWGDSH